MNRCFEAPESKDLVVKIKQQVIKSGLRPGTPAMALPGAAPQGCLTCLSDAANMRTASSTR
jgi:hypothetical protein